MVFAFPAYHSEKYTRLPDDANPVRLTMSAAQHLGWQSVSQDRDSVVFSTRRRLLGRSERVTINFLPDRALMVTSRCFLPTQCLDWGKNRRNVMHFLSVVEHLATAAPTRQG